MRGPSVQCGGFQERIKSLTFPLVLIMTCLKKPFYNILCLLGRAKSLKQGALCVNENEGMVCVI